MIEGTKSYILIILNENKIANSMKGNHRHQEHRDNGWKELNHRY